MMEKTIPEGLERMRKTGDIPSYPRVCIGVLKMSPAKNIITSCFLEFDCSILCGNTHSDPSFPQDVSCSTLFLGAAAFGVFTYDTQGLTRVPPQCVLNIGPLNMFDIFLNVQYVCIYNYT